MDDAEYGSVSGIITFGRIICNPRYLYPGIILGITGLYTLPSHNIYILVLYCRRCWGVCIVYIHLQTIYSTYSWLRSRQWGVYISSPGTLYCTYPWPPSNYWCIHFISGQYTYPWHRSSYWGVYISSPDNILYISLASVNIHILGLVVVTWYIHFISIQNTYPWHPSSFWGVYISSPDNV